MVDSFPFVAVTNDHKLVLKTRNPLALEQHLSLLLPSFWWLLAILGIPWFVAGLLHSVISWSSLCIFTWTSLYNDTSYWLDLAPTLGGSEVKASARNAGDLGLIPGSERSPGEGNGTPLKYFCLENPMDGGALWAIVHRVTESWTRLSDFTFHFSNPVWPHCNWLHMQRPISK